MESLKGQISKTRSRGCLSGRLLRRLISPIRHPSDQPQALLSLSKAVADSLVAVWNDVVAASISNTESIASTTEYVANQSNGRGADSANGMNNVPQDNVINGFPDLQTGLITFPGSLPGTSVAQGLAADVAAVSTPEPSTLILFGTGLILVTRRFARRGKH
jgi:hypothetical protein